MGIRTADGHILRTHQAFILSSWGISMSNYLKFSLVCMSEISSITYFGNVVFLSRPREFSICRSMVSGLEGSINSGQWQSALVPKKSRPF